MSNAISVELDASQFKRAAVAFAKIGKDVRPALARAINHTGDKARTQIVRALVEQTGAKYGAIRKALVTMPAMAGGLTYRLVAKGSFMSLKEFGARQTQAGVSAAPWGTRRVFPHTFIVESLGGHVFERRGRHRVPIRKLWGPAIPREMVKDKSRAAFEITVAAELPGRLEHEIGAILNGAVPG